MAKLAFKLPFQRQAEPDLTMSESDASEFMNPDRPSSKGILPDIYYSIVKPPATENETN